MPYSVALDFNRVKPDSSEECKLHISVELTDDKVNEAEMAEAAVVVVNRSNEDIPTPTVIVGIPGGLDSKFVTTSEVLGREVVLYWRALKAEERVELPISLVAAIPGNYTGPSSRAYLYYTDKHKHWVDGLKVEIEPKASG